MLKNCQAFLKSKMWVGRTQRLGGQAWVTPVVQPLLRKEKHERNILIFVYRMWKAPVLYLSDVCRGLINTGIVRRGGLKVGSIGPSPQDNDASPCWSSHPLMLNCLTALLSAFPVSWPGFFGHLLLHMHIFLLMFDLCLNILWRTTGQLWIDAQPLHQSI